MLPEVGLYRNPYLDRLFKHVIRQDEAQKLTSPDINDRWNYDPDKLLRNRDAYLRNMHVLQQAVAPFGRVDSVIYPAGAGDFSPAEIIFNPRVVIIIDHSAFNPIPIPDIRTICRQAQKLLCLQSMWGYVPGNGAYPSLPSFEYTLANLFLMGVDPKSIQVQPIGEHLFWIRFALQGETKSVFYLQEAICSSSATAIAGTIRELHAITHISNYGLLSKGDLNGITKLLLPFLDPALALVDHLEGPDQKPIDNYFVGYIKYNLTGSLEGNFGYAGERYGPYLFVRS